MSVFARSLTCVVFHLSAFVFLFPTCLAMNYCIFAAWKGLLYSQYSSMFVGACVRAPLFGPVLFRACAMMVPAATICRSSSPFSSANVWGSMLDAVSCKAAWETQHIFSPSWNYKAWKYLKYLTWSICFGRLQGQVLFGGRYVGEGETGEKACERERERKAS